MATMATTATATTTATAAADATSGGGRGEGGGPPKTLPPRQAWLRRIRRTHRHRARTRQGLLAGVAILELVALSLVAVLNAGGQPGAGGDVLARHTYLLKWTDAVAVDTGDGHPATLPFTLYWFLNGLCVQEPGPDPVVAVVVARSPGANFHWPTLDRAFSDYMDARYPCNASDSSYDATPTDHASSNSSACQRAVHPDASDGDTPGPRTGPPPPRTFGRTSFVLYLLTVVSTGLAWPGILLCEGGAGRRPWQERGLSLLMLLRAGGVVLHAVAAGLLTAGIQSVAGRGTPPIDPGDAAVALVWSAVALQLVACLLYAAAAHGRRPPTRAGPGGGPDRDAAFPPPSRSPRPRLPLPPPPVYGPRIARGCEELPPPYAREDPLGRPPSIAGYRYGWAGDEASRAGAVVAEAAATTETAATTEASSLGRSRRHSAETWARRSGGPCGERDRATLRPWASADPLVAAAAMSEDEDEEEGDRGAAGVASPAVSPAPTPGVLG